MKRERKVRYQVSSPGLWWCGKDIGWVENDRLFDTDYEYASTSRTMYTAKRAFSHATTLPKGTIVTRFFIKKGKRFLEEFEYKG